MSRLTDGIVWVGVGVSLVAQAGFILMATGMSDIGAAAEGAPAPFVEGASVGIGFLVAGGAALWHGIRRVRARRNAPPLAVPANE